MKILKNQYNELRSGWAVAAVVMLIIVGQLAGSALVPGDINESDLSIKIIVTLVYSLITIVGGVFLFKLIYKRPIYQLGLIKKKCLSWLLHGAILGTISMGLVFFLLSLTGQLKVLYIDTGKLFSFYIIIELLSVGFTAFSEELLARGFIMTAFKTTRNKWVIFCASSLLFSLVHLLNPGITALSIANTFLAGILFAYMFIKSGALWLPSGFHVFWNVLQGDILGMNVSGNEQASVFFMEMGTKEFLTGGKYGPEGGILVTCVLLLCLLYIRFFVKKPNYPIWTMESDLPLTRGNQA